VETQFRYRRTQRLKAQLALLAAAQSAAQTETTGGPGWLERELVAEYQQIRDAAFADPVKPSSNDQFQAAIDALTDFARHRADSVSQQVVRARTAAVRR
jgi:hypothetical protein